MRILYFSRDYTPHDHRFLTALAQSEHTIGYLRLEDCGQGSEDRALPSNVEIISWAGGRATARLGDGPRLLSSLRRVLHSFRPDVVHAGPLQTTAFLTALTGFRQLVGMSWGYDLLIDADKNPGWAWATRFTLRHCAAMVGDCETVKRRAAEFGMDPKRVVTFPWGVDLSHFQPGSSVEFRQRLGWGDDCFVLLSTRSWSPLYGIEDVARGFVQAAKEMPQLRLVMASNGPQAGLIRQIFQQAGVMDKVHLPGQIKYADLPRYYRGANLYLSASHSDGSSISLLEALACGTPALVSDIPGNREWINPDEQGWLFREGDPGDLAKGILHAADESERLKEMAAAARRTTEVRADWQKNFPKLFDAYAMATGKTVKTQ